MRPIALLSFIALAGWSQASSAQVQSTVQRTDIASSSTLPKGYVLRNGKLFFSIPIGNSTHDSVKAAFFDATVPGNQCSTIPPATDATMTEDNLYSMSIDVAASLKIQVPFGSSNVSGAINRNVFMRQFKRFATCTTPNGDILEYGQALRATVLYDANKIEGNASFAFVVAQATISNQTTQIDVQNTGFTDAKVITPRSAAMASLTGGALTIDNYGTFMSNLNQAMSQAEPTTVTITSGSRDGMSSNLQLVGREIQVPDSDLSDSLAKAFALYYIAGKYGCVQAQDDFSKTDLHSRDVVKGVYISVTKACGAPSDMDKATAQAMLRGMKIGKPAQN